MSARPRQSTTTAKTSAKATARVPAPRRPHDTRSDAVAQALESRGLTDPARHGETLEVLDRALGGSLLETTSLRRRLAELAGYVGGAFVVAAGALFAADQWTGWSTPQQIALLVGVAVLFAGVGVGLATTGGGFADLRSGAQPVRRRLVSVLLTAAGAAVAGAVVVWLLDLTEGTVAEDHRGSVVGVAASLTLLAVAAVGYRLAPTVVGQGAVAVGAALAVAFAGGWLDEPLVPLVIGAGLLAVGGLWLVLAERRVWREQVAARVLGAAAMVVGAQLPLGSDQQWVSYLLTFAVAVAGFALYVARHAWPYLAAGVVAMTLVVPEALGDWTGGTLGTAGVLLVAGVTLLVASLVGLRLRKEVQEVDEGR